MHIKGKSIHSCNTTISILYECFTQSPIHKKINLYRLRAIDFHAHAYGFCQPYSKKGTDHETGYEEEKWHWSYMPVSGQLIKQYESKITYSKITGFKGSGTGKVIDVIKNYVLGIAGACK